MDAAEMNLPRPPARTVAVKKQGGISPKIVGIFAGVGIALFFTQFFSFKVLLIFLAPLYALKLIGGFKSFFITPKSRMSEWLATTFAAGVLMLIVSLALNAFFEAMPSNTTRLYQRLGDEHIQLYVRFGAMVLMVLAVFYGSGRGWMWLDRVGETQSGARLKTLVVSWIGTAGAVLIVPVFIGVMSSLGYVAKNDPGVGVMLAVLSLAAVPPLMLIPWAITMRRFRKFERENPVPSQSIVDGKMKLETSLAVMLMAPMLWVMVPFLLKANTRVRKRRAFAPVEPSGYSLRAVEYIERLNLDLEHLGFTFLFCMVDRAAMGNEVVHIACWRNDAERISATGTVIETLSNNIASVQHTFAMMSHCKDAEPVVTNDSSAANVWKTGSPERVISLCGEKDITRFLIVQRALLKRLKQEPILKAGEIGVTADVACQESSDATEKEMANAAKQGIYAPSRDEEGWRLTWKGAFVLSWCSLWPFLQFRQMSYKRKMTKRLAEMGIRF